jgi:phage gpG-like protein
MIETKVTYNLPELDDKGMLETVESLAQVMLNEIRTNFGVGGRPDHWENLKKGGPCFLYDTGALLESLTPDSGKREDYYWARVSTDVPYAMFHQFGTEKMPRREFMNLPPEAMENILRLTAGRVVEILKSDKPRYMNKGNEF